MQWLRRCGHSSRLMNLRRRLWRGRRRPSLRSLLWLNRQLTASTLALQRGLGALQGKQKPQEGGLEE